MGNSDDKSGIGKKILVPASVIPGMLFAQRSLESLKPTIEYVTDISNFYQQRLEEILNLKEVTLETAAEDDTEPSRVRIVPKTPKQLSKKEMLGICETYGLTEHEMLLFRELVNNAGRFVPTKYLAIKVGVSKIGLRQLKLKINRKLHSLGVEIYSDQKAVGQAGRYSVSLLTR